MYNVENNKHDKIGIINENNYSLPLKFKSM